MSSLFKTKKEKILNDLFIIGIMIKGLDGILELIGGFVLIFIKASSIPQTVERVFQHEILQDPTDLIANYFIQFSHSLSISTIYFIATYLIINGTIKVVLFLGLWYKKLWSYPIAGILLSFFTVYQFTRFLHTHSLLLLFLTLVDILIITLLKFEYKRLKHSLEKSL